MIMEKTRTLYRLRKYKNSVIINLFFLISGILLISFLYVFESEIYKFFNSKNMYQLSYGQNIGLNNALLITEKSMELFQKAALFSIIFSIEGFLMITFFIRLSHHTKKFYTDAAFYQGLGILLIFIYYIILGLYLPGIGNYYELSNKFQLLKIFGFLLIVFANIIFAIQIFLQIILEKIEQ